MLLSLLLSGDGGVDFLMSFTTRLQNADGTDYAAVLLSEVRWNWWGYGLA